MEVRLEGLSGSLPAKSYIGVRIGNVQKQAPYDPKTLYRFPEVKRFGKIDIFQRVGMCDLSWGCDDQETHTCKLLGDTGDTGIRLQVSMNRLHGSVVKSGELVQIASAKSAKQTAAQKSAKYIQAQNVEDMLTAAMKALLKQMPDDAAEFLCDFISKNYSKKRSNQIPAVLTEGKFEPYYSKCVPKGQAYFASFHQRFFPTKLPSTGAAKAKDTQEAALLKQLEEKTAREEMLVKQLEEAKEKYTQLTEVVTKLTKKVDELEAASRGQAAQDAVREIRGNLEAIQEIPPHIHALRDNARLLINASARGELQQAIAEAKAETKASNSTSKNVETGLNPDWAHAPSVGTWAIRPLPSRAERKQRLQQMQSDKAPNVVELRAKARKLLLHSNQDGTLQEHLKSVMGDGPDANVLDGLRDQARSALINASGNGKLNDLLSELATPEVDWHTSSNDVIRERVRGQLLKAAGDGSMFSLLHEAAPRVEERPWVMKPSVGTWLKKPTMISGSNLQQGG